MLASQGEIVYTKHLLQPSLNPKTKESNPMLKLNNPSITDSISKLDPKSISNASPRHIQSVLEDLIVVCLEGQALADKVLRLNPKSEEIGAKTQPRCGCSAGMLANLQEIAGKITKIY